MEVEIPFPLPYRLPVEVEQDLCAVSTYKNYATFKIMFDVYTSKIGHHTDESLDFPEDENTLIRMTIYPELLDDDIPKTSEEIQNFVKESILHGLSHLNKFLDSFRFMHELDYVRNIHVLDMPKYTPVKVNGEMYIYVRETEIVMLDQQFSKENIPLVLSNIAKWDAHPGFGLAERFFSRAQASLYQGEFLSAIIELQTSFEILIRNTVKLIILHRGRRENKDPKKLEQEVQTYAEARSFRKVFEKNLSTYLNVNLSFDTNSYVKRWKNGLYRLRNEIVHAGRSEVYLEDAKEALESYIQIRSYLNDLLIERGYLDVAGDVDLSLFPKPAPFTYDVVDKLKRKGVIAKEPKPKNSLTRQKESQK